MDITGARWGLDGAEAVLKLRALKSNGDFQEYWRFHLAQERKRVHEARYAGGIIPLYAPQREVPPGEPHPTDYGARTVIAA
jgi:hypothetical protein